MKIQRYHIKRVRRMLKHFPAKRLNGCLGHVDDVRAGVVVLQENAMSPIRSLLLYSVVESMYLLKIEFCIHRVIIFEQFVVDNAFPASPYTQHLLTRMKILSYLRRCLFVGANPSFSLLHIDVQGSFFVTGNNWIKESLVVSTSWPVTNKQTGGDNETLISVNAAQSMRNPRTKLLNLSHRVKLAFCGSVEIFHYLP